MRKLLIVLSSAMLLFSAGACQKKEEQPAAKKSPMPRGPIMDTAGAPAGHGTPGSAGAGPKTEFQVIVPPEVNEQWLGVTIVVEDKQENKQEEFTVKEGDEFKIPDSTLTVKVGPFLPDFTMSGTVITSSSNEPNNPTVGVAVMDDGKKVFPPSAEWGWLFAKFPTIHSFQHDRFALVLKAGTQKEEQK